jgi:hypothetical protein
MYSATIFHKRPPAGWPWYTALLVVTILACALILIQSSWQQTRQIVSTTQVTATPIPALRPPHSPLVGYPPMTTTQLSAHPATILQPYPLATPQPHPLATPQTTPEPKHKHKRKNFSHFIIEQMT